MILKLIIYQYNIAVKEMDLEHLRAKYKTILEEPQSENSEEEWEATYSQIQNRRKKRVLTEANNNYTVDYATKSIGKNPKSANSTILSLKQKLGQCLFNLSQKNQQNTTLKQRNLKLETHLKGFEEQIQRLNEKIENNKHKEQHKNAEYKELQTRNKQLQIIIEELNMDKELFIKQIEHYKSQTQNYKLATKQTKKKFESVEKQIKGVDKAKNENERLKQDIKRMHVILNDSCEKKVTNSIKNKHYLGKPKKQSSSWFPINLVGQVETFLKKEQVGFGNRDFKENLVKFIDQYCKKASDQKVNQLTEKQKKMKVSKIRYQTSASLCEMKESIKKKSNTLRGSFLKSSLIKNPVNMKMNESKRCTESFIYDHLQKSIMFDKLRKEKHLCLQILEDFKAIMEQFLCEKQLKKKKIRKVIEQMSNGILQIFESLEKSKVNERGGAAFNIKD